MKIRARVATESTINGWFGREKVLLDGMTAADEIPLMYGHRESLGNVTALERRSDGLHMEADILVEPRASFVAQAIDRGWRPQFSIGAEVLEHKRDKESDTILFTDTLLREVSIVPVGADPHTTLEAVEEAAKQ